MSTDLRLHEQPDGTTTIVCLCGSASQKPDFEAAGYRETMAGKIVLPLIIYSTSEGIPLSAEHKLLIVALHYQKIDMAHEILVILKPDPTETKTRDERIGGDTQKERDAALTAGKVVNYFDPQIS